MSIIDELLEKKKTKYKPVKAKVTEELCRKIVEICKATGIKQEEYLGKILEESEIDKVYKQLEKTNNQDTKKEEIEEK
mgnify:CR=1 FL=1